MAKPNEWSACIAWVDRMLVFHSVPMVNADPARSELDCSYRTWQQCIETARGLGRYCLQNPCGTGRADRPSTQGKSRGAIVRSLATS